VRSVIAGYHWFTDWGRDTMISLEGLTCTTGRFREAGWILRTFGQYIRDGLIPNMFPDGSNEGLYHTADATLWFFHALDRYLKATDDRVTLEVLLPKMHDIVKCHLEGTRFGIHVDPKDGLLVQGALSVATFWIASHALRAGVGRFGYASVADPAGLPWLALVLAALGLVLTPLVNAFSRYVERQADDFALALTRDPAGFIGAMERLATLNLAERRPHPLKEALLFSHPALDRRIARARAVA